MPCIEQRTASETILESCHDSFVVSKSNLFHVLYKIRNNASKNSMRHVVRVDCVSRLRTRVTTHA